MRRVLKIGLWLMGILLVAGVWGAWYFLGAFGGGLNYYHCENGYYYTYPRGVMDGSNVYYNKYRQKIGECRSWIAGPTCAEAEKLAGKCSTEPSWW